MNEAIEPHDSELVAVTFNGDEAVVSWSPACFHRGIGEPGPDGGSGFLLSAELTLGRASLASNPARFPAAICDGKLRIGPDLQANIVPASGVFSGAAKLHCTLGDAESLTVRARRISIQLHGEPSFVESFTR